MKETKTIVLFFAVSVLLSGMMSSALAAGADQEIRTEAYVQPQAHWHEINTAWMDAFHHPMENMEMGLDIRLREVYARNILMLSDKAGDSFPPSTSTQGNWNNYHWQRYRTRWSMKYMMSPDVDFNLRLVWEFWGHCLPEDSVPARKLSPFFDEHNYDFDEAIFDHFNIQWRNFMDLPLTLTVGRQDIILGTGWLVLDGTPGDGSRTIFFDAIRAQYQVSDATKLDLIYIQQYDDEDEYIKPFNHSAVVDRRNLTQGQDEKGFILYLTNKVSDKTSLEGYYIYKKEEQSDLNKWWVNKGYTSNRGKDSEIHTFGGRLYGDLNENWSYSAEGALQFGKSHNNTAADDAPYQDLCAYGTNNKLMYSFHDEMNQEVHIGYEFLSGDGNPNDGTDHQFNPLWGDWPQYQRGGDLQSYIWAFENKGLGNVVNMHRVGIGHSFKPCDVWTVATDYNLFWADETNPRALVHPAVNNVTNDNFRGHMLSGIATYSCCKKFKTHFMLDYFLPGSYYAISDNAFFARVNLEWTF